MAKLYFRYGTMGSSKTANALMVAFNYKERGQRALLLKPCIETRDGEQIIKSRIGLSKKCSLVEEYISMGGTILSNDYKGFDCIIVDEAQFLSKGQVEALCQIVDEDNIPVICYGLRTDFRGEFFSGSGALMAMADKIEEIKTVCWCGCKATHNARFDEKGIVRTGKSLQLGGNEQYVGLCRKHFNKGEIY